MLLLSDITSSKQMVAVILTESYISLKYTFCESLLHYDNNSTSLPFTIDGSTSISGLLNIVSTQVQVPNFIFNLPVDLTPFTYLWGSYRSKNDRFLDDIRPIKSAFATEAGQDKYGICRKCELFER